MTTTQSTVKQAPVGITPYDKEWGIGVSGTKSPSPIDRTNSLLQRWWDTEWSVDHDRAVLLTEAYQKFAGMGIEAKMAHSLAYLLDHCKIAIYPDELIVGGICAPAKAAPVFPEFSYDWVKSELEERPFSERPYTAHVTSEETNKALLDIAPQWAENTVETLAKSLMTEEQIKTSHLGKGVYSHQLYLHGGIGHCCPDFQYVAKVGFGGLKTELETSLAACDPTLPADLEKREFYLSELVVVDAIIAYCRRYSQLAIETAKTAKDDRKKELMQIAENCAHIATDKPRNFWEALQLVEFIYNVVMIESNGHSVSYGRMDQYLNPFYQADLASGEKQLWLQELLESFTMKTAEMCKIRDGLTVAMNGGHGMGGTTITLGGVDRQGADATNDLTYMIIDAIVHTRLGEPWLAVRWHEGTPQDLKVKCTNAIRVGFGRPKLFNDGVCIPSMKGYDRSEEDARDYAIVGCVELDAGGKEYGWHDSAYFSMPKVFELAINNGRCMECETVGEYLCPIYATCAAKGKRLGLETGSIKDFKSFAEVTQAFDKQMEYMCDQMVGAVNAVDIAHQRRKPLPGLSLFIDGCAEKGQDVALGGARYNFSGPQGIGIASVADSMAAIKQLVFEEKRVTGADLITALEKNWENYEWLHALVNSDKVHHYGNDDDYADELATLASDIYCQYVENRPNARDGVFVPGVYSVTANVGFGQILWASADGRKIGEPVSDNCGAVHTDASCHDMNGPTAMIKSVCKLDHVRMGNGTLLNLKFSPSSLAGETGRDVFIGMVDNYFEMGGLECQINVLSRETLEDAVENPNDHKQLLVRVAGYSAFFNDLGVSTKLDIINRTELSFD